MENKLFSFKTGKYCMVIWSLFGLYLTKTVKIGIEIA